MPVNYLGLKDQIRKLGVEAHSRQSELLVKLDRCRTLLNSHDRDLIGLQQKVEQAAARNKGLRCAVPVSEPLTSHFQCTLPAPACTILAADGSQINPDPHDSVYYGLINIGIFRIAPGSGETPSEHTQSELLYGDALLSGAQPASEDLVALLRDVRERQRLAEMAEYQIAPVITLTDGPLELYHEPRSEKQFEIEFKRYLDALSDLAQNNVITAGYVSRPRADLVVSLLALLESEEMNASNPKPFAGITDISLLENLLGPGERSAIFRLQSSSSAAFEGRKALHFFYLNVGTENTPAFARVEIPMWVVENPSAVALLHSVLVEQSLQSGAVPYPYPLIRAHEIAVVKMTDHQQMTVLIEAELLKHGIRLRGKSEKQTHKEHGERTRLAR
jgi:hypothetical protein